MAKRSLCLLLVLAAVLSLGAPAFAAEEPVATEVPVEVTEAPVEVTEEPTEAPEGPVEETEAPAEVTEAPAEVTEEPVEETEVPAEATEEPVEETEAPAEATEEPVEVTEAPAAVPEEPIEVPAAVEEPAPADEPEPAAVTPSPSPAPTSGTCGTGVNWAFDAATGTLTISGSGAMDDLSSGTSASYYAHHASIKKVEIGSGVTRVGNNAFHAYIGDYKNLVEVVIADTVTSIGYQSFYFCNMMTTAKLPSDLTTIEEYAFASCGALASVEIPDGVTSIGKSAFGGTAITSVKLPSGLKTIEEGVFGGCPNLTTVVIPEGVTSIGNHAFYNDKSMTSVTLPSTVTSIGIIAFGSCPALTSIDLPDGLQAIGREAFEYSGLTDVTIPASVGELVATFYGCSSLKTLTILNKDCQLMNYDQGTMKPVKASAPGAADEPMTVDVYEVEPLCPKTTTIRGYANSTAEEYAEKNGNPFEKLDGTPAGTEPGASDQSKPAQPKVSKVTNVAGGVKITWNAVSGATTYRVFYKGGNVRNWKKLADTSDTSYTWPKAKSGTKYSFSVRASNAAGNSSYNKTGKSVTYMATPKVKSAKIDASGVKITWAKVNGASKYQVMYKVGDGKWKVLAKSVTGTSYTWKKAKSGTSYTFSVRAVAKDGSTGAYNETGKSLTYIAAPKVKSAKKVSGGIKITWAKVNGAAKYQVMYKVGNGKWKALTTTDKQTFTWKKAKSGTKYTFSVRAVTADGTKGVYNTTGKSLTYKK